jgi:hypothetical protein
MSLDADRASLLTLLRTLSFERRKVILSSGKESDFYIDCKRAVLTAEGHFLAGRLLFDRIRRLRPLPRGAGGLTLGADPLASAVALTSFLAGEPIDDSNQFSTHTVKTSIHLSRGWPRVAVQPPRSRHPGRPTPMS